MVTNDSLASLGELVSRVRDLINAPRRQAILLKDQRKWHWLCSSMDAAADTEFAVLAHRELASLGDHDDTGLLYLSHYGFVQALYLQQSAVRGIASALGFDDIAKRVDAVKHIMTIRHDVAHMTDRDKGKRFLGIVQVTMTPSTFETYSFNPVGDGAPERVHVNCRKLEAEQADVLSAVLSEVITRIEEDEQRHRDEFKTQSLADIFKSRAYLVGKVSAGVTVGMSATSDEASRDSGQGQVALGYLERMVREFREALTVRGYFPDVLSAADYDFERAEDALARLEEMFASPPTHRIIAEGVALVLAKHIENLSELAADLDRTYAKVAQGSLG